MWRVLAGVQEDGRTMPSRIPFRRLEPTPDALGGARQANALRVVMRNLRWQVVAAGEGGTVSVHDRRDDAIDAARALGARLGVPIVVFDLGDRPIAYETPLSRTG
jgi:uncharacterized protein DUF2188